MTGAIRIDVPLDCSEGVGAPGSDGSPSLAPMTYRRSLCSILGVPCALPIANLRPMTKGQDIAC